MTHPKLAVRSSGDGGRGYKIPGRFLGENGKEQPVPSVTTVLKHTAKPALIQWAADQTAAYAVANLPQLMMRSEEVGWGYLRFFWSREADINDTLRSHHEKVKNDAAELGTNIHEWIEADLTGSDLPAAESNEVLEMIEVCRAFAMDHDIFVHNAEFTVVNTKREFAGTADADWEIMCLHDDPCFGQAPDEYVRILVDLKSSRHTWPEHGMQMAALRSCDILMVEVEEGTPGAKRIEKTEDGQKVVSFWVEKPASTYDRFVLLHIRPSDLDTKGERIEPFVKVIDITEDMDLYDSGFAAALTHCRNDRELKRRVKAREETPTKRRTTWHATA